MGLGMLLGWIIPLGLIIAFFLSLTRRRKNADFPGFESAIDILEKEYARGSIGREEFLRKRDDLSGIKELRDDAG